MISICTELTIRDDTRAAVRLVRMLMRSVACAILLIAVAMPARADLDDVQHARGLMMQLESVMLDINKEATRDANVLKLISEAVVALDDWQLNNALAAANDKMSKAQELIANPFPNPRLRIAVENGVLLTKNARERGPGADLAKLREELRKQALEPVRSVVADDIKDLAFLNLKLTQLSNATAQALSLTSAAALSRGD